jgi:transcriptional regulator GlxA family with amidase domain
MQIAILKYPAVQLTAVYGLTDMFMTANGIMAEQGLSGKNRFCVTHLTMNRSRERLITEYSTADSAPSQFNIVIIPGSLDTRFPVECNAVILDWIQSQHSEGAIICSVCKGAFILAESGLLTNRPATTHWALKDAFAHEFPDVNLQVSQIFLDDGDIITAGGVMAWLDLGLRLIHRYTNSKVMMAVAKYLLIDPSGREQKYYSAYTPTFDHGDRIVVKAQHWLQNNFSKSVSLDELAEVCSTSVRTLIRRFQKALGESPTSYIQQLRVGKAQELLEFTTLTVNQVSWDVGYKDPGAFSKIFRRTLNLSPAEYRRRFNI